MFEITYDLSNPPQLDWIAQTGAQVTEHQASFGNVTLRNDSGLLTVNGDPCFLWRAAFQRDHTESCFNLENIKMAISSQRPRMLGAGIVQAMIDYPALITPSLAHHLGNLSEVNGSNDILIWGTTYQTYTGKAGTVVLRMQNGKLLPFVKPFDRPVGFDASLVLF